MEPHNCTPAARYAQQGKMLRRRCLPLGWLLTDRAPDVLSEHVPARPGRLSVTNGGASRDSDWRSFGPVCGSSRRANLDAAAARTIILATPRKCKQASVFRCRSLFVPIGCEGEAGRATNAVSASDHRRLLRSATMADATNTRLDLRRHGAA